MKKSKYKNVLLKLSGEALMGDIGYGIDPNALKYLADQLYQVKSNFELKISIVVGGGNIWRGADYEQQGMDRSVADSAGMLGTMINALALQDSLERKNVPVRTLSALSTPSVAEPFIRRRALRHLEKGRVIILAGGTGNPYMTTDTAAAQRSLELNSEVLIMSKNNVDGIYNSDPNRNDNATKFDHLTPIEALEKRIKALDSTALSLCMDNDLPIIVFDIFNKGSLESVLLGNKVGTLISNSVE
ncbi:MAG: UMP kinase [Dehalococcoidia bacterium]|jgi:uridylate kinase|nr:UMP kinase [Dehalococcoidia bacterium]|tara:strand:- start:371 stop:1102 length:732 start_codon:yes stop_codon:yes gene_type:complete